MFTLTPNATRAIVTARGEAGAPNDWGVRFYAALEGPPGITFHFVGKPEPNDILGGSEELRTFVEMAVHRDIGDATVDCVDANGEAEFVIRPHRAARDSGSPASTHST